MIEIELVENIELVDGYVLIKTFFYSIQSSYEFYIKINQLKIENDVKYSWFRLVGVGADMIFETVSRLYKRVFRFISRMHESGINNLMKFVDFAFIDVEEDEIMTMNEALMIA